jgi:hypothetical protein
VKIDPEDLTVPARLVLSHLRAHPDQRTTGAMADGPLARVLGPPAIETALVELRAQGLARELHGEWHLTSRGHEVPVEPPAPERCSIATERRGTVAVVTVEGGLDEAAAGRLATQLEASVDDGALPEIVLLDLAAVDGLCAAAVAAVDAADARGRRTGARLVVLCGPGPARSELERAGLGERLTFVESARLPD